MAGQVYIPERIEMDVQETFTPNSAARYIKNLVFAMGDTSSATASRGGKAGVYKPLESNAVYVDDFVLPVGTVQSVGRACFRKTKQAFIFSYSSKGNHAIFRINGEDATIDSLGVGSYWNFQLDPRYFINDAGGCYLEEIWVADPTTGLKVKRTFLFFTDAFNNQGFVCVEDAIATQGFNANVFPYFKGNYDPNLLVRMGTMTPNDCIKVTEIPLTQDSVQLSNDLLYNTWQFRLRYIDVWGKPSEYGIMSDIYIPGGGGCIQSSTNLARCLALMFQAPPPHINQVEVCFRNCNTTQWYLADTLDLYNGSPLGEWWTRSRNANIPYDPNTGLITYTFCADAGCDPIDPTLTSRLNNPLPLTSNSVAPIGAYTGVGGNRYGQLPFSQDLKEQFTLSVTAPSGTVNTARNIEIFIEIFNPFNQQNQPIYYTTLTGSTNKVYAYGSFHGINSAGLGTGSFADYQQWFTNINQSGFIGTLVGTGSYVVSQQYIMDQSGNLTAVTDFTKLQFPVNIRYFQKFTFTNLNPQKYIFRITSQQIDPTLDPTYIGTSTTLRGAFACNFSAPSTNFSQINHSSVVSDAKELLIDVCNANYSTLTDSKILVIYDISGSAARAGYVKNTNQTGVSQIGIELAKVGFTSPQNISSQFTDHNGFFFVASQAGGQGSQYNIFGYCSCKYISFTGGIDIGSTDKLTVNNWYLNDDSPCLTYDDPVEGLCNYIVISGQIVECGTNIGVPNVAVVLSRGGVGYTDNDGNFSIIAHDDATTTAPRQDSLYYITSSCPFTDCNGNCLEPINISINKCTTCGARNQSITTISVEYISLKGLLSGGTYPVGVTGWEGFGRPGFVQPLGNLMIPPVYQTKAFGPSQIGVQMASNTLLPPWIKYLTFWVGEETTIADYVDWIVDSFIFVDNTGLENTAAPTQIKIFYASLIEYNKQNNYNTTVNWSFLESLPNVTTQTPVTTDRVQFLMNGDGTFFSENIVSLVKYDQTGQYFLINYTPNLANLVANARIRLFRPKVCQFTEGTDNTAPYFELCSTILVNNGIPASFSAILNAFDTYYIYRGIIPVPTAQPNSSPIAYIDEPRLQGLPFEHNSPSDFWGQGCANFGRVSSSNDQETVLFKQNEVALSDAVSTTGLLNFLCFFGDQTPADFTTTGINGITAILPETGRILIIGQDDHLIVGFNDNMVRANADGTVQTGSIPNSFGQPYIKIGQNWGCRLIDKNTIYKKEGLVHWLDTSKVAVIQHNYTRAFQVSKANQAEGIVGGIDSWLRAKIKEVQNFNLANGNIRYFHGIVNPQAYEYILTDYTIGSTNPVNSERGPNVFVNETMAMDIFTKHWKCSYGFVPEMYAEIEGELNAQQLFTFLKSVPYSHYNDISVKSYGQMYGQTLVRVLEPVISIGKMAKKKPLSMGVICKQGQYFVDRATTEGGQRTRMLLSRWIQAIWGWYAPFMCDLNTPPDPNRPFQTGPGALFEGNMLVGDYIKVRLIGDPATDTTYTELEGVLASEFKDGDNLIKQ